MAGKLHIHTGFSFVNYNAYELLYITQKANNIFYNQKRQWHKMMENGMNQDFSWDSSAKEYEAIYDTL